MQKCPKYKWESDSILKMWITPVLEDDLKAFCKYNSEIRAQLNDLIKIKTEYFSCPALGQLLNRPDCTLTRPWQMLDFISSVQKFCLSLKHYTI